MVSIQRVEKNLDRMVIDPYNKLKNDMMTLNSRSNDLKLKIKSSFTSTYIYALLILITLVGVVTKNNLILFFSGIVLGGVVLINILYLVL